MRKLTFSIIFGLTLIVSGKPCFSQEPTEKIINVKCATCHGSYGISKGAGVPHLAGQPESYLQGAVGKIQVWRKTTSDYVNNCGAT